MWQQLKLWLKTQTIDIKVLERKLALKEKEYDNLLSAYINLKVQLDFQTKSHDLSNFNLSAQAGECLEPQKLDIS